MITDALFSGGLEDLSDLPKSKEEKEHKWRKHNAIESGFYLLSGTYYTNQFNLDIALVHCEEDKVFIHSRHKGFKLSAMIYVNFLGPFENSEEVQDAKTRIKRNNS